MNTLEEINLICDYIISTVQTESSGFQYVVDYSEIANKFEVELDSNYIELIADELSEREEVADIVCDDDGFDVVLYTNYAPNYSEEEE